MDSVSYLSIYRNSIKLGKLIFNLVEKKYTQYISNYLNLYGYRTSKENNLQLIFNILS